MNINEARQRIASDIHEAATSAHLLNTRRVAALLNCSESYLEKLRQEGGGPAFVALSSKMIRYRYADVWNWINSRAKWRCKPVLTRPIVLPDD